jgi:hypothetical protein
MMPARLAIVALVAAAFALPTAAHANVVTPSCTLGSLQEVGCGAWHPAPVTLRWTWDPFGSETMTSGCGTQTFTSDTPPSGTKVTCTVWWGADSASHVTTLRVDSSPPLVTSAAPARPPDHDGWFNHPVAFTFHGTDATSGIAACDTVTFAGPAGAGVTGGCRDAAGNRGIATFPIQYDATPPAAARVTKAPGNRSIELRWNAPPDAVKVTMVRLGRTGSAARKMVYQGSGDHATDRGLKNGVRYRYSVTVFDQAGNGTATRVAASPTASTLRPVRGTVLSAPPRLTWRATGRASYYNVQVFKGKHKILSAWPHGAHLQLPLKWKFRGRQRRLSRGTYRWYVWPGYGSRAERRYGPRIGGSAFRIRA